VDVLGRGRGQVASDKGEWKYPLNPGEKEGRELPLPQNIRKKKTGLVSESRGEGKGSGKLHHIFTKKKIAVLIFGGLKCVGRLPRRACTPICVI